MGLQKSFSVTFSPTQLVSCSAVTHGEVGGWMNGGMLLLCFSCAPTLPWPSTHLFGSRHKTPCSPRLGNTRYLLQFSTYKHHAFPVTSLRVSLSSAVRSRQDKKMQVNIWCCFLFIALTLLPERTSSFDHFADNIQQSAFFHKSKRE